MKIGLLAVGVIAGVCSSSFAGFVGWTAKVETHGAYTTMDVFAGMESSSDKLLNVFNMNITANGTAFRQAASSANNKWRPNLGVAAYGDDDSFVTLGGFDDGGTFVCGDNTTADPNFTNYATSNATTIVANAGWFSSDPTSSQNSALAMAGFSGSSRGAAAGFGVWVAHFSVLTSSITNDSSVFFSGRAAFNSGTNSLDTQTLFFVVPAPGALALLGVAGFASRRRRA